MDPRELEYNGIGYWANGKTPEFVGNFCTDSRKISKNECFIAIQTQQNNGNLFVKNAEQNGAICAIVNSIQNDVKIPQFIVKNSQVAIEEIAKLSRKNFHGKVIGITGSYGKTTTKEILKLLLNISNNATNGNENGELGVPITTAKLTNDEQVAIIEIGIDKPNSMQHLCKICDPDFAIVTGIGLAHAKNFHDQNHIAHEKFQLVNHVLSKNGTCIVSKKCLEHEIFRSHFENFQITDETIIKDCNVRHLHVKNSKFKIPHLMSDGITSNLALAISCAKQLGISDHDLTEKIERWTTTKLRGEIVTRGNRTFFVDCYNANDVSFFDSLANFNRIFPDSHRLFIIGALKESEIGKNSENINFRIGQFLPLKNDDKVILIGAESGPIKEGILSCTTKQNQIFAFHDKEESKPIIEKFVGPIYLKGHRSYALETLIL